MGLLDKLNPRATVSTVIHRSLVGGIVGASVYCLATVGRQSLADYWPLMIVFTLISMLVGAVYQWQVPEEPTDLRDLAIRLERRFGIRISSDHLTTMVMRNDPPEIRVGELFDLVRDEVLQSGVLDLELDADSLWPTYQRTICDALGIDLEEVTKDKGLIRDLGVG